MENQEDKSLLDFLKVQPNETDRAKVTNQRALLAGATPLLVGLLAGNTGDAYEIASKALLDEDQRKLKEDGSLIDYLRKRTEAQNKAAQSDRLYTIREPDGTLRYVTADKARGAQAPFRRRPEDESVRMAGRTTQIKEGIQKRFGKGYTIQTDPVTGEKFKIYKGEEEIAPQKIELSKTPEYPDGWNKNKEKLTQSTVSKFNASTKKQRDALNDLEKASSALESGGKFAEKLGVMGLVKDVETRLSDYDRAFYIGEISYLRKMGTFLEKEKSGRLPKYIVDEAKQLIKAAIEKTNGRISDSTNRTIRQLKAAGIPADYARQRLGAEIEGMVEIPEGGSVKPIEEMTEEEIIEELKGLE